MGFNTTLELHGPELGILYMGSRDAHRTYTNFPQFSPALLFTFYEL